MAIRALIAHPELGGTSELGFEGQTFGARTVGSTVEEGPCVSPILRITNNSATHASVLGNNSVQ
jgi:hypothetical protein